MAVTIDGNGKAGACVGKCWGVTDAILDCSKVVFVAVGNRDTPAQQTSRLIDRKGHIAEFHERQLTGVELACR